MAYQFTFLPDMNRVEILFGFLKLCATDLVGLFNQFKFLDDQLKNDICTGRLPPMWVVVGGTTIRCTQRCHMDVLYAAKAYRGGIDHAGTLSVRFLQGMKDCCNHMEEEKVNANLGLGRHRKHGRQRSKQFAMGLKKDWEDQENKLNCDDGTVKELMGPLITIQKSEEDTNIMMKWYNKSFYCNKLKQMRATVDVDHYPDPTGPASIRLTSDQLELVAQRLPKLGFHGTLELIDFDVMTCTKCMKKKKEVWAEIFCVRCKRPYCDHDCWCSRKKCKDGECIIQEKHGCTHPGCEHTNAIFECCCDQAVYCSKDCRNASWERHLKATGKGMHPKEKHSNNKNESKKN